jgi:uncharacterized protein (DUF302 family)
MADTVIRKSRHPYDQTVSQLVSEIAQGGGTLFAKVDQSAAATGVGLTLRPTTLLVFGNPKGGTPLMEAFPLAALDLPLKLLVWEENGSVSVAYTSARAIAVRYDVTGQDRVIAAMDHQLETLTASIA